MATYKDLDVYQRSFACAIAIYKMSLEFPRYLQHDLADDIRRAARSIPSNIAEGYGRDKSSKDKINFLKTALGSCDEVLFNLNFSYIFTSRRRHTRLVSDWSSDVCSSD